MQILTPRLPRDEWLQVVQHAPLVSIDLIITNPKGEVLLGWRNNKPAQHCWFVPGGVVRKNETLQQAFERVVFDELGELTQMSHSPLFYGVYEHHYPDSFSGIDGISTHYIVLAHRFNIPATWMCARDLSLLPKVQHQKYIWMPEEKIHDLEKVHVNTKAYFLNSREI